MCGCEGDSVSICVCACERERVFVPAVDARMCLHVWEVLMCFCILYISLESRTFISYTA